MGCGGSKPPADSEAVALCRDRTRLLADAIRHRYALADAHADYSRALRSAGLSLHRFLDALRSLPPAAASPVLPLPPQRKGDPLPPPSPSPSHSGSHIHFHSDDDSGSDSPLHSANSTPIHHRYNQEPPAATYVTNYNYAKSTPAAAAVSYEKRPMSPEQVQYGGGGGYGYGGGGEPLSYFGYPYPAQNSGYDAYTYPNYASGGYFGGSASPPPNYGVGGPGYGAGGGAAPAAASPSTSRAAPPPPSPPRPSAWDFLDPFGSYTQYEENVGFAAAYTPSRSSREVREEEGIPDLEDEEHEVVKEVHGNQKLSASTSAAASGEFTKTPGNDKGVSEDGEDLYYKAKAEASSSKANADAHVVEKNVVGDEVKRSVEEPRQSEGAVVAPRRYNNPSEVVLEIRAQFEKASGSFDEVSRMLEVGKVPYRPKKSVYKGVSASMMMCGLSVLSTTKNEFLEYEEDKVMESGSLSSTLRKLYMWEQKLYDEVKIEEKLRVVLERERQHLRRLDERGAESNKLEATQMLIRKLSTKIKIAIQVVASIANKISKLRDEELWPQISELIHGLMRMWRVMLECHRTQYQAISEAAIASSVRFSDVHMEEAKQFELELLDLIACFSIWVSTQKSFVRSLNEWLLKGLRYVNEETSDGIAPFSPGRIGAPPVFVICNYWSQSIDRISEKEVVDAMKALASNVLGLWEQHKFEQRQSLMANKDMDTKLKILEKEEQEMRRAVEVQNKKLALVSGHGGLTLSGLVHHGDTAELSNLQLNLRQIFEALESFTAMFAKAYEELEARSEEERLAKENSALS